MDAKQAIRLLEPIGPESFIRGEFTDNKGKCCAIGHLVRLTSDDPTNYNHDNCSDYGYDDVTDKQSEIFKFSRWDIKSFLIDRYQCFDSLAGINNSEITNKRLFNDIIKVGEDPSTIKGRVMGVLKLMKKINNAVVLTSVG